MEERKGEEGEEEVRIKRCIEVPRRGSRDSQYAVAFEGERGEKNPRRAPPLTQVIRREESSVIYGRG